MLVINIFITVKSLASGVIHMVELLVQQLLVFKKHLFEIGMFQSEILKISLNEKIHILWYQKKKATLIFKSSLTDQRVIIKP